MNAADKVFAAQPVELYQVHGNTHTPLQQGVTFEIYASQPSKQYPLLSAVCKAGEVTWQLQPSSHTMRSISDAGEPTFIFSYAHQGDADTFYCVILKRGHPAHELVALQQLLSNLCVLHVSRNVKKNQMPFNLPIPQVDPNTLQEIMRKGAEDTQLLLQQAGTAANRTFPAAAELHKKYAPTPGEQPVQVPQDLRDRLGKSKQAATAGAAVAKGVATGMQAATVQISTTLMQTAAGNKSNTGSTTAAAAGSSKAVVPEPVAVMGGIGLEVMRDIAAVRDAVLSAAGNAWHGARVATVDVMNYQYGTEVGAVTADGCDAVEGVANMAVAMKYAQPTQVLLTSVKDTSTRLEVGTKQKDQALADDQPDRLIKQLEAERAALEREKAAFAAEKAKWQGQQQQQQQQRRGVFGLPYAFS